MELLLTLLILILLIVIAYFVKELQTNKQSVKAMQNDVKQFQDTILTTLYQNLNTLNENNNNRLYKMEHSVQTQLEKNMESTNEAFNKMMQQVVKIDKNQDQLQELSKDINNLQLIFSDKKSRGIYGEVELYTLLQQSFGDDTRFWNKQYKLADNKIVDAVIFGNDSLGIIPIDSKFPLENYRNYYENGEELKKKYLTAFKNDLKKHIDDISDKYIISGKTSEFALMFIPAEAIYSFICANLSEVLDYSYQKHVYIASPTTLMAYATSIKALYIDQKKNEQVQEMQDALFKLSDEFVRFKTRYEKLGKDVNSVLTDFNSLMITAEKIEKQFNNIKEVKFDKKGA